MVFLKIFINIFLNMKIILKFLGYIVSIPARVKGMRIGRKSYLAPGYDILFRNFKNIKICERVFIDKNADLRIIEKGEIRIGDETNIGKNVLISSYKSVEIGKKCLISYNVSIIDHNHDFAFIDGSIIHPGLVSKGGVLIEDDCFIGANSFILSGVILGRHCIVGANSVVTKSFPEFSVIAGNPARLIKKIVI